MSLADDHCLQKRFVAAIRNNDSAPTGLPADRFRVYHELLHNNIESFITCCFPVIQSILSQQAWQTINRDFFKWFRSDSPYFHDISNGFVTYCQTMKPFAKEYPFLPELAHYEWAELAIDIADPAPLQIQLSPQCDFIHEHPVISPLAWLLQYQYPVHQISVNQIDVAPVDTFIIVYRDRDDNIGFVHINPVVAKLLDCLYQDQTIHGGAAIAACFELTDFSDKPAFIEHGLAQLQEFFEYGIILGTSAGGDK